MNFLVFGWSLLYMDKYMIECSNSLGFSKSFGFFSWIFCRSLYACCQVTPLIKFPIRLRMCCSSLASGSSLFIFFTFSMTFFWHVMLPLKLPVSTLKRFLGFLGKHTDTAPEATWLFENSQLCFWISLRPK